VVELRSGSGCEDLPVTIIDLSNAIADYEEW